MSATLDATAFSKYFGSAPVVQVPGRTFPVEIAYAEDIIYETGYKPQGRFQKRKKDKTAEEQESGPDPSKYHHHHMTHILVTTTFASIHRYYCRCNHYNYWPHCTMSNAMTHLTELVEDYDLDTAAAIESTDFRQVNTDLIEQCVVHIFRTFTGSGGVLVFLPGHAEITTLANTFRRALPSAFVVPLHSSLSPKDQALVFSSVPSAFKRRLVLSTNIAETSITVPDIEFVVDSCFLRETRYDPGRSMSLLVDAQVSHANAQQRSGRAGRVKEGRCWRLLPRNDFEKLPKAQKPELHRTSLEQVVLQIATMGIGRDGRSKKSLSIEQVLDEAIEVIAYSTTNATFTTSRITNAITITMTTTMTTTFCHLILNHCVASSEEDCTLCHHNAAYSFCPGFEGTFDIFGTTLGSSTCRECPIRYNAHICIVFPVCVSYYHYRGYAVEPLSFLFTNRQVRSSCMPSPHPVSSFRSSHEGAKRQMRH